jgi:hypothetical protein
MSLPSFNASTVTLVVLFLFSFLSIISEAAPSIRTYFCPDDTNFIPNSTYQSNLNLLFSSLSSNATRESGFYNTTVGQNTPNIVYGLFLCRGDVTTDVCQDCVTTATKTIAQQFCPTGKEAIIWYNECMLRYSNESFFSNMSDSPVKYFWNDKNITEHERFNQLLGTIFNDLVTRVTSADQPGAKKFATKEANFSATIKLYSLVQCTPDISSSSCNTCLRARLANLPVCCGGKQGATVLTPSCNVRYEVYPFYRILPPPPAPAGLVPRPNGKFELHLLIVWA